MTNVLWLMLLLQIKHFVFDWVYQPPYMWKNKGTFGHWGGIVHSGLHAAWTALILALFGGVVLPPDAAMKVIPWIALGEFIAHYLIDWAKMNINRKMGWTATTHHAFWVLTGFDQLLHQLTYLAIIAYWVTYW
ncbi:hypothetical protein CcrC1_gp349 [Caulobacter phage C1]|nr:hypothetical protein CcrC1_gp349 [Caulobacter phage C1]UTU08578.1 hypothetical protein CcrC2_gp350 [Caulobacter phage C2]UTU09094.1 hypothetical protein CcrJ4_gp345 [Caulobacter phage J4]UTU09652.1 hypothetical protein CcrBL47_gp367 [Caulobacter phage BL47]UTU10211.1 hypothetical protein CcrRB23_gp349 [Caulobacter phage RB23]WGN97245.1 hypothetical protein [Bertelyvirus sp.]